MIAWTLHSYMPTHKERHAVSLNSRTWICFWLLETCLITTPVLVLVLAYPDFNKNFVLETNASLGLKAVATLSQIQEDRKLCIHSIQSFSFHVWDKSSSYRGKSKVHGSKIWWDRHFILSGKRKSSCRWFIKFMLTYFAMTYVEVYTSCEDS